MVFVKGMAPLADMLRTKHRSILLKLNDEIRQSQLIVAQM